MGRLRVGDKIVDIDGLGVAARIGPEWILRDKPQQASYTLKVNRGGLDITQRISWPVVDGGSLWCWVSLLEGFVYLYTGLGIAFAKPDSLSARRASVAAVLMAAFYCVYTLNLQGGMLTGFALTLACISYCTIPYHIVANYWFAAGFPMDAPETGRWRGLARLVNGWVFLLWLPHTFANLVRAFGPERALWFATACPQIALLDTEVVNPLLNVTIGLTSAGIISVCLRNYNRLIDATNRRRLRWVLFGIAVGVIPVVLVVPLVVAAGLAGHGDSVTAWKRGANAFGVIIPLCIAYAVVKHKVLGIRVVLRAGVQYLLAKNVLRAALLCPLLFLALYIAFHFHESLSDLARGNAGRLNFGLLLLSGLALTYRTTLLNRIDRRFFREVYKRDQIFVKLSDAVANSATMDEVSRLLCSEIRSAMHPRLIFLAARTNQQEFSMLYSEPIARGSHSFFDFAFTPSQFERLESSRESSSFEGDARREGEALQKLDIQLVVPVRGPNEGFLGMLLLGERRSEEPYSRNDRRLLDTIASHTGVVWENLQLRGRLKGEHAILQRVMARSGGTSKDVVQECPACGTCYDGGVVLCSLDGRDLTLSLPMARLIDGKYLLTRLVGRGGMGLVYEAYDKRLSRTVAVKVTAGSLFGNEAALRRFGREARAAATLNHPNVVRVFDIGELTGGGAYMVLEFLRGVTLRHELRRRVALPIPEACRILSEIASGVEEAHRLGVVHRDLKPENVFLAREYPDSQPVAKILDFGLAVIRDLNFSSNEKLTRTGSVVGTLTYMSREQFLGETVDQRVDIYSLAIVALETISGEISTGGPMFSRIGSVVVERLCRKDSPLNHRELAEVLKRALLEDREARYASIREFRAALIPALAACPPIKGIVEENVRKSMGAAETAPTFNDPTSPSTDERSTSS